MTLALVSISSLSHIFGVAFGLLSLMFAWFSTIYLFSIFKRSKVTLAPEGFTVRRVLRKPVFVAWHVNRRRNGTPYRLPKGTPASGCIGSARVGPELSI